MCNQFNSIGIINVNTLFENGLKIKSEILNTLHNHKSNQ